MRAPILPILMIATIAGCSTEPAPASTQNGTLPGLVPGGDTSGYWRAKTRKYSSLDQLTWLEKMVEDADAAWRVLAVVDAQAPDCVPALQALQAATEVPEVDATVFVLVEAPSLSIANELLLKSGTTFPGFQFTSGNLSWKKLVDPKGLSPSGPGLWIWAQGMTSASYYPWPEEEGAFSGILFPNTIPD